MSDEEIRRVVGFALQTDFGRKRGLNPTPTEEENAELLALDMVLRHAMLTTTDCKTTSLVGSPRVILHRGFLLKRNRSIVRPSSKREVILLSDHLLILSIPKRSRWSVGSRERVKIHNMLPLHHITIRDFSVRDGQDCVLFELSAPQLSVPLVLIASSPTERSLWIQELLLAIQAVRHARYERAAELEGAEGSMKVAWGVLTSTKSSFSNTDSANDDLYLSGNGEESDSSGDDEGSPHTFTNMNSLIETELSQEEMMERIGWFHRILKTTPHSAALSGDMTTLTWYMKSEELRDELQYVDEVGMLPLHWAVVGNHMSVVQFFIDIVGVHVDVPNINGHTPLHLAIVLGNTKLVQWFLRSGADLSLCDHSKRNVYKFLVMAPDLSISDMIGALQKHGLELTASLEEDEDSTQPGRQLLHEFAASGRPEALSALLGAGADVHAVAGIAHQPPLLIACAAPYPHVRVITILLAVGARPNLRDIHRQSPFSLIMSKVPSAGAIGSSSTDLERFKMLCIPSLQVLLANGARPPPQFFQKLDPSFEMLKVSVREWQQKQAPETFSKYWAQKKSNIKIEWEKDGEAKECNACASRFSFTSRRHHCRACGKLVCAACSEKRLPIGENCALERSCDCCFTSLTNDCKLWERSIALASISSTLPSSLSSRSLYSRTNTMNSSSSNLASAAATSPHTSTRPNNPMNETKQLLEERGQKLSRVQRNADHMVDAANEFRRNCRQLKDSLR